MLRWAVTEAIQRQPAGTRPRQVKDGIIARRGTRARDTAKVAAARELLTLVFCGLRDGAHPPRRHLGTGRMTWTGPAAGREAAQRTAPAGHRPSPTRQRGRPRD
jgi:hypothetical protein